MMADLYSEDYEVKDEELVDFEGSDYGFESDEELEVEEEVAFPIAVAIGKEDLVEEEDVEAREVERQSTPPEAVAGVALDIEKQEGAESGEIDEREDRDEEVVAQSVRSLGSLAYQEGNRHEGRIEESRARHRKADLEDGELDDAAMPEGSGNEAEGNADDDDEDDRDRRERKRRKDRFAAERRSEDLERKEREPGAAIGGTTRQYRNRGSDRQVDRLGGISKPGSTGGRGMMHMGGFGHPPNMAPGIMGPGRPLVPLDMGPVMPMHPMGRGFMGSLGGMLMPGGVGLSQFQEAMVGHEQMIRHRMMQQFVQANAGTGPGRPPMMGPPGGPAMRPMMGLEFGAPIPHGMMHMQAQGPDMPNQMNFPGPMDYPRSPRSSFAGRGAAAGRGMFGEGPGRMGSGPRNGMARQASWPPSVQTADVHAMGRGRGQGRGPAGPPVWADSQGMAMPQAVSPPVGVAQPAGIGQNVKMGHPVGPIMTGSGAAKMPQGQHGAAAQGNQSLREGVTNNGKRTDRDSTMKAAADQSTRNGSVQHLRSSPNIWQASGGKSKRERENGIGISLSLDSSNSHRTNLPSHGISGNGVSVSASNLIQLGGPVQKSRLLTVSGLNENTTMSVVVEAFEKQGKVTDFKKEERGDAFTITFASVSEAISAKRNLHRSIIAGRQITVEYAVQRPST